jgi:hypothetical protein
VAPARIAWRLAAVKDVIVETPRAKTLVLDVPGWPGQVAGQHVDVRLTAEDGYQAQRSYSIASAPEDATLALTVKRLADGEVSPYLTHELRPGDELELRGPIGGTSPGAARTAVRSCVAGGSGPVPLMAMVRHRAAHSSTESRGCCCPSGRATTSCTATSWQGSPCITRGQSCGAKRPVAAHRVYLAAGTRRRNNPSLPGLRPDRSRRGSAARPPCGAPHRAWRLETPRS